MWPGEGFAPEMYDSFRDGIVSFDTEGRITGANRAFREMLGYGPGELKRLTCRGITPEKWHDIERRVFTSQVEPLGFSEEYEKEFTRKDGRALPVSVRAWLARNASGEPAGIRATVRDVSDRADFECRLAEAKANWEKSFRSVGEAMFLVDMDLKVMQHNEAFARLVGRESENLEGLKCHELLHGLGEPPDFCVTCAAAREGRTSTAEIYEPYLDRHLEVSADPTFDEEGNFEFALHIIRDITERKRAEAALRESESKYRQLFENMQEGFAYCRMMLDDAGKPVDWEYIDTNKAFESLTGLEDVDGRRVSEVLPGLMETNPELFVEYGQVAATGSPRQFEARLEELSIDLSIKVFSPEKGYFVAVFDNVTGRKAAEEKLRLTQFEVDNAGEMIVRVDREGRIRFVNDAACRQYGDTSAGMLLRHVWDLDATVSREQWRRRWVQRKEEGRSRFETEWKRADGTTYPVEVAVSFLEFEGKERIVAFARDISDRKRVEVELARAERRYRELSESLPQVVFELDGSGMLTYVNRNALDMFGYTQEDFEKGVHALQFIEEVDRERVSGAIDKVMDGRSDGAVREYLARRKDGTSFPCVVYSTMVADDRGERIGIRGILTDISERKEFEKALEESERKYRELANTLPEVVFEVDERGVFTYVNESGAERFGYRAEEIVGKLTPLDVIVPEEREKAIQALRTVLSEGSIPPTEFTLFRHDGERFQAVVYGNRSSRDGEPFGMSGLLMDISERKRYEEQLQKVNAELDGFAHTVSHDLKGPLTVIGFASELIEQNINGPRTEEMDAAMSEAARLLSRNVTRASDLIGELLTLAEAGQTPSALADVDVRDTVETVLDEYAAPMRRKGITTRVAEHLGTIQASPTHIYQVFANLIGNAVKHAKGPGIVIEVKRLPEAAAGAHRFLVRDSGAGIDPRVLEKVFVPFFKGESGGTGIGLSTVQKVVKLYGGWIKAYNDGGACFEFVMKDWEGETS